MEKYRFTSKKAYIPSDTVSQIVVKGNIAFVSGQISYDVETGRYIKDDISNQTRRVLNNMKGILSDLNLSLENVVYCDITLSSMALFDRMDEVYKEFFTSSCPPARKTVASQIWDNMDIEISAVVLSDELIASEK